MTENPFTSIKNEEDALLIEKLDRRNDIDIEERFKTRKSRTLSVSLTKDISDYIDEVRERTNAKSRTAVLEVMIDLYYSKITAPKQK